LIIYVTFLHFSKHQDLNPLEGSVNAPNMGVSTGDSFLVFLSFSPGSQLISLVIADLQAG
jgi:hypothetical protein